MKRIQQYCNVVNRIKHDPACREEVLHMATRKEIRVTKRGAAMGTAVAAALVALNIGGGYLLLSRDQHPETSGVAMSDLAVQTDDISASSAADYADYVTLMQQYYTGISGKPCDFDFTGYGKDFDYSFENDEYKVTLRAVTGCNWVLYYFYDVEPKQGQTELREFPVISLSIEDEEWGFLGARAKRIQWSPGEWEIWDDGVWHVCGIVTNVTDVPFSAEGHTLSISAEFSSFDIRKQEGESLDFLPAWQREALRHDDYVPWKYDVRREWNSGSEYVELDRWTFTPFGAFYVSEKHPTINPGDTLICYTAGQPYANGSDFDGNFDIGIQGEFFQTDETRTVIDSYTPSDQSYCGTMGVAGEGVSFIHVLFDHPWDTAKGQINMKPFLDDGDDDEEPITSAPNIPDSLPDDAAGDIDEPIVTDAPSETQPNDPDVTQIHLPNEFVPTLSSQRESVAMDEPFVLNLTNQTPYSWIHGEDFTLYDAETHKPIPFREGTAFRAIARVLSPGQSEEIPMTLSDYFDTLSAGEYLIEIKVNSPEASKDLTLSAPIHVQ